MNLIFKVVLAAASWAVVKSLSDWSETQGPIAKKKRERARSSYPVHFQDFVSAHPDIVAAFTAEHGHEPRTVPVEACAGFRLAGSFFIYQGGNPGSEFGDVSLMSRDGDRLQERNYPEYPYLHLYLFPDSEAARSALSWEKIEQRLPRLVQESVKVGLGIYRPLTERHRLVVELACRLLAENKDPEFARFLETAPIFCVVLGDDRPTHISLEELKKAEHIRLEESYHNPSADPEGTLFLEDSWAMREICQRYELPFSHPECPMPPPGPMPEEVLMSRAVRLDFAGARWRGDRFVVSNNEGEELVIDRQNQILRVPVQGEVVELPLEGLQVVRQDRRAVSDTKEHEYCYLFFKQADQSASICGHFKTYHEGGKVQADLDKRQDVARAVIDRLAGALESGDLSQL